MEDDFYMSGGSEQEEDAYCSSDQDAELLDGIDIEADATWVSLKAPSSKVCAYYYSSRDFYTRKRMHVKKK